MMLSYVTATVHIGQRLGRAGANVKSDTWAYVGSWRQQRPADRILTSLVSEGDGYLLPSRGTICLLAIL